MTCASLAREPRRPFALLGGLAAATLVLASCSNGNPVSTGRSFKNNPCATGTTVDLSSAQAANIDCSIFPSAASAGNEPESASPSCPWKPSERAWVSNSSQVAGAPPSASASA